MVMGIEFAIGNLLTAAAVIALRFFKKLVVADSERNTLLN